MSGASPDAVFGYAPGKVILFGEHAVVYGQPAIAATIDRGIRVAVTAGKDRDGPVLKSHGAGLPPRAKPGPNGEGPERLREALARLVELCGERTRELSMTVDGSIPAGAGLGSSAALAVAMLRGVTQFFGDPVLPPAALIERAFVLERVFHGNPSGVDHTVIATGGCLWYRRNLADHADNADNADHPTSAYVEPVKLSRRLRLAVGVAGPHAGTAHAVGALRDRMKRHGKHYDAIVSEIGALANDARHHLEAGALGAVGELMDLNHGLLNALGVSTPAIEALVAIARNRGALGAKISGAGGGGAVIALIDDDPQPVVRAFEAAGFQAFEAVIAPAEERG